MEGEFEEDRMTEDATATREHLLTDSDLGGHLPFGGYLGAGGPEGWCVLAGKGLGGTPVPPGDGEVLWGQGGVWGLLRGQAGLCGVPRERGRGGLYWKTSTEVVEAVVNSPAIARDRPNPGLTEDAGPSAMGRGSSSDAAP